MKEFEVLPLLNEKVIAILDVSEYEEYPNIAELSIQFPNFKKEYSWPIEVGGITVLNTKILKQDNCVNLFPDGLYTITYKIDGEKIEKKYFRTISAQIKLNKMLSDKDSNFNTINKIYLYLRAAETSCDENLSKEFYNIADKLLSC